MEQNCVWLFYYFNFERNCDVLKSKSPCILLNESINFNKNKTESKMENPTVFERQALSFSAYKNRIWKVKLWWVGALERKKRHFLYRLFCPKEIVFNICVLSQCTVYWIHFLNIILLHIQKHYFIHFCCLFLKSSKRL